MNAAELRIGNWYNQFGNYHQASWDTIKSLENAPVGQLWCKPIPLTEEILLKAGFKRGGQSQVIYSVFKISKHSDGGYSLHVGNAFHTIPVQEVKVHIKYVHQLQNLYYALTGTELTIKL